MRPPVAAKDLADLASDSPRIKYGRAKSLLGIAKKNPKQLYPHRRFFVKLLKSENNILKWTAIDIIGYLSSVDAKSRVDVVLNSLAGFLHGGKLITANHAIGALARIALARPALQDRVTAELLSVEHSSYESEECRNIALGKVIEALGLFCNDPTRNKRVLGFVRRQTTNARPATRKKAERFLANLERPGSDGT
jgi:hypothetical protein